MARAISRRGSDRRRYSSWEVLATHIQAIIGAGGAAGMLVLDVDAEPARTQLLASL
ncbi:hypothetical protein [Nocardia sp. SC052]|uniref:hypothetical protein n=1 Tax=Nocardia sichangensis TaxID=3385975 RepID=UPI00399F21DA